MNTVCIVGRLTKDPAPKKTQNGKTALRICVAVDRGDKNKTTDFIDCQAWDGKAEFIAKYFHKGSPISITGKLFTRVWEKDDGSSQKITDVYVSDVYFVPRTEQQEDVSF